MNPVAASFMLREAIERDRPEVNAIYASLGFMPWNPQQDHLLVAVTDDRLVGCGRIQRYGGAIELGGMYVHPNHRGKGIARQILVSLVDLLQDETCYCIPFAHLIPFYQEFGFMPAPQGDVPAAIVDRVAFFRDVYMHPTILMVRN